LTDATLPAAVKTSFERLRRPLSVLAVIGLLAALWLTPASTRPMARHAEIAVGFLLVLAAVLGRLWCILYIAGRKNTRLCADGPYALSRNPLYVFSSLGLLGVLLATHHSSVAFAAFAVFWVLYHFVIRDEEARLARLFGDEFSAYRLAVPRIVPRFAVAPSPATLDVSVQPVLRAFREVVWFFLAWLGALLVFGS
jgi:protein-S-isoprenylcysteine O-methyltransferase Ste14